MVSVGVRLSVPARAAWTIGAATVLAAATACEDWARLWVKWPNDLYAPDGRKVGGVLVETTLDGERLTAAVIGLGLNVNWRSGSMPPEIASSAASLSDLVGATVDRTDLLSRYLTALDAELEAAAAGGTPIERLRARSWLDGHRVLVELGAQTVEGRAVTLGDDGELLVETDAGIVPVAFGEVVHVRAAEVAA